jgi:hypothetical protein
MMQMRRAVSALWQQHRSCLLPLVLPPQQHTACQSVLIRSTGRGMLSLLMQHRRRCLLQ